MGIIESRWSECPAVIRGRMIRNVQLLRALAALSVFLAHMGNMNALGGVDIFPYYVGYWGTAGVDMFFVISGFIMVYIARDGAHPAQFFFARAARIYPLWWIASLLALCIATYTNWPLPADYLAYQAKSFLLLPSHTYDGRLVSPPVGVGWSLIYEMLFYLVFAAMLFTGMRWLSIKVSAALLALHTLSFVLPTSTLQVFLANPVYLEFILGMLVAELYCTGLLRWYVAAAMVALGAVVFSQAPPGGLVLDAERHIWFGVPLAAVLALALALENSGLRVPRFLVFLGDASYALYLAQHFVSLYLPGILFPVLGTLTPWLWFALILSAGQAIACVVYIAIDRPLHNAARRMRFSFSPTSVRPIQP